MSQVFIFAALVLLALARIPAVRRNGRDNVFLAALFAAPALGLNIDAVYATVDEVIGGQNILNLIVHLLIIQGLWYLRTSFLAAVFQKHGIVKIPGGIIPLIVVQAGQVFLFAISDLPETAVDFAITYSDQLSVALYSGSTVLYIAWVAIEMGAVCLKFQGQMQGVFRAGFILVIAGSLAAIISASGQIVTILSRHIDSLAPYTVIASSVYNGTQMITVVCIGLGLTLPPLSGAIKKRRETRWETETITGLTALWENVLDRTGSTRSLPLVDEDTAQDRIHRLIVEIRDAELSTGPDTRALADEEQSFVTSVEKRVHAASNV